MWPRLGSTVTVIDGATDSVITTIAVGDYPSCPLLILPNSRA
ncbi:MAG: hypothetical protein JSU64_03730 [candidate division WOR-3 bacterium]|nr:MAG: hypothetical protein JSU64_03730 [candidate division WOR-3 bacterium]